MARTIADAVQRRVTSDGPVNLAFGSRVTLLELLDRLENLLGGSIERIHTERRPGDVPHSQADSARLSGLFPAVAPVHLDEGLAETAAWMRRYLAAVVG